MLLGPEDGEEFGDPDMDRSQAVKPSVAGRADGDQEPRLAQSRLTVMNVEFGVPCSAALAPVLVAGKDDFAVSAEVIPRVPAHPVALRAEAGDRGNSFAAGAKQRLLPGTGLHPGLQDAFRTTGEG
jgi:hypothetical protein